MRPLPTPGRQPPIPRAFERHERGFTGLHKVGDDCSLRGSLARSPSGHRLSQAQRRTASTLLATHQCIALACRRQPQHLVGDCRHAALQLVSFCTCRHRVHTPSCRASYRLVVITHGVLQPTAAMDGKHWAPTLSHRAGCPKSHLVTSIRAPPTRSHRSCIACRHSYPYFPTSPNHAHTRHTSYISYALLHQTTPINPILASTSQHSLTSPPPAAAPAPAVPLAPEPAAAARAAPLPAPSSPHTPAPPPAARCR